MDFKEFRKKYKLESSSDDNAITKALDELLLEQDNPDSPYNAMNVGSGFMGGIKQLGSKIGSKALDTIKKVKKIDYSKFPDAHIPEDILGKEVDYNYRLNNLDDIHYYKNKDNDIISHVGLDGDGNVKSVYVNPEHRGKGIATSMYEDLLKSRDLFGSDNLSSMEPEAKSIWESLRKKYPENIYRGKERYEVREPIEFKNITDLVKGKK